MRARDVSRLWQAFEAERATALAEREAFAAERRAWIEERKFLLNAALAKTQSEFLGRQQATKPAPERKPITDVPVEAVQARRHVMGL